MVQASFIWPTVIFAGQVYASVGLAQPTAQDAAPPVGAPSIAVLDVVLFAAGTVEIRPPSGWRVFEAPYQREMRVVLLPGSQPQKKYDAFQRGDRMPDDGIWLTFHPRPPEMSASQRDLTALMKWRLPLAAGADAQMKVSETIQVAGHSSLLQRFTHSVARSESTQVRQGFHLLIPTDWGICEMHAVTTATDAKSRQADFDQVVAGLRFHEPAHRAEASIARVRDAAAIVGAWKAFNSRLRLHGDGRIVIAGDRRRQLDRENAQTAQDDRLVGLFEARDDLLLVTWRDGSRLNFRWRRRGNDLLLTDHSGKMSRLQRLLE